MFKDSNFRESDKFRKGKQYPFKITKPAKKKNTVKQLKKDNTITIVSKRIENKFNDKDFKNITDMFTAYGFIVINYPHHFKLINEDTNNSWNWWYKRGALLQMLETTGGKTYCKKFGNFLDPEEACLAIKKYDI